MLYTQALKIPDSGTIRIGEIGGEPYEKVMVPTQPDGKPALMNMQVGYMLCPRVGFVKIDTVDDDDNNIFLCRASVRAYDNRPIDNFKVPGQVYTELPCSVVITGPPGTRLIVEAWHVISVGNERGAARSHVGDNAGIPVPTWARTVDFSGSDSTGSATFRNAAAVIVGVITGQHIVNFTIPDGAVTVDISSTSSLATIVFRQQG